MPGIMARKLPNFLSPAELNSLISSAHDDTDRTIIKVGAYAGLRVAEIVALRIEHVDLAELLLYVKAGKGDKDRNLVLHPLAAEALAAQIGSRITGWVFPSRRAPGQHLTTRYVQRMVHEAAFRAAIRKRITPHTLRHTFASRLLATGADITQVQLLLGHEHLRTTTIYLHAQPERLRSAVERL